MAGRPRTKFALALAGWMLHEIETGGPATMPELLERIGYGDRQELSPRQVAAVNMATRELLRGPIAVDPWTGRLHYHRPGTRVPWAAGATA